MDTEQEKTLEGLRLAIAVEEEGGECYLRASRKSSNELGRRLLKSIAADAAGQRKKFEEIYETVAARKGWPVLKPRFIRAKKLRADFEATCPVLGTDIHSAEGELEALQEALKAKDKAYEFYRRRAETAGQGGEASFYEALATEERSHFLVLSDYLEFIKDPAGFFVMKEHQSLDGA